MAAMTVREWREANAPEEVTLPSGKKALLRRVHILDVALTGEIPGTLVVKAEQFKSRANVLDMLSQPGELAEWMGAIDAVCIAAFVAPKVGREPTEEQLGIEEVSHEDRLAIFAWVNGGAAKLEPFRPRPDAGVEPAPDRE